jgi:CubicO group peptidase (beta-lactamase class C family)
VHKPKKASPINQSKGSRVKVLAQMHNPKNPTSISQSKETQAKAIAQMHKQKNSSSIGQLISTKFSGINSMQKHNRPTASLLAFGILASSVLLAPAVLAVNVDSKHHQDSNVQVATSANLSNQMTKNLLSPQLIEISQQIDTKTDVLSQPNLKFDKAKFEAKMREGITDKDGKATAKGFAVVLIKNGKVVHEFADGLAVDKPGTANDVKMTTSIPTNIGSAFKTISAISLLNFFENDANPAISVNQWLDKPFWLYLPQIWQNEINASKKVEVQNIKKITFRQLLQHKSGFLKDDTMTQPRDYLLAGVKSENMGRRVYQNANFTLLTYVIPNLVDPGFKQAVDAEVKSKNIASNNKEFFGKRYGDYFEQYLQSKIFNKITPKIKPSCDPEVDYGKVNKPFARHYSSPTVDSPGTFWSEKKNNGGCHAQGGYYLSAHEFAAFMANYSATETLISKSLRQSLYNPATLATRDERIVWAGEINSPFIKQHFGVDAIPYHGGEQGGYRTAVVQFPENYMAVAVVNSGPMSSGGIATHLKNAWGAGLEDNFKK